MMQNLELLQLIKDTTLEIVEREMRPPPDELARLRTQINDTLTVEAPLSELGWDSVRMTWLLVRLEERLAIDTSTLSLYELFTVGDLLQQLQVRLDAK
ncbi:MAG: acyl carrier protein [Archangium sp.]|nr:acyl carrier protein [Archangium sp.]